MVSEIDAINEVARLSVKRDERGKQLELLEQLTQTGVDPRLFDLMMANELDRDLKSSFAWGFYGATILFTILSYGVIVLNAILHWGISEVAITGLIIETPIQFIGLLYIIAKNLFPQSHTSVLLDPRRHVRESTGRPNRTNKQQTEVDIKPSIS